MYILIRFLDTEVGVLQICLVSKLLGVLNQSGSYMYPIKQFNPLFPARNFRLREFADTLMYILHLQCFTMSVAIKSFVIY